jgi:hypothetical protein
MIDNIQTNKVIQEESELSISAVALIAAMDAYTEAYAKEVGKGGAVTWMKTDSGKIIIMSDSQYANTLMRNIDTVHREIYFETNDL